MQLTTDFDSTSQSSPCISLLCSVQALTATFIHCKRSVANSLHLRDIRSHLSSSATFSPTHFFSLVFAAGLSWLRSYTILYSSVPACSLQQCHSNRERSSQAHHRHLQATSCGERPTEPSAMLRRSSLTLRT